MNLQTRIRLNDGNEIPVEALGVFQSAEATKEAVLTALKIGYRHIDTAAVYQNEEAVGQAIKESGILREEIFVTTKLWNEDIRQGRVREALAASLQKLGLDYVDLYLIHWPAEGYVEAYKTMLELQKEGKIRSIGVSNFKIHHLEKVLAETGVVPAIDQMEFHPQMQDNQLLAYCKDKNIGFEAWSPLGRGACLNNPQIIEIGRKYNKTGAQIILRWLLQKGIIILPKSVHEDRIRENAAIYDFALTDQDVEAINNLNENKRIGPDPDNFDF